MEIVPEYVVVPAPAGARLPSVANAATALVLSLTRIFRVSVNPPTELESSGLSSPVGLPRMSWLVETPNADALPHNVAGAAKVVVPLKVFAPVKLTAKPSEPA